MSTGDGHGHQWERNGEFCVTMFYHVLQI